MAPRDSEAPEPADTDFLQLLGNMRVAVFKAALDSTLLSLNQAGADILGARSPADVLGKKFSDFYSEPADRAALWKRLASEGQVIGFRFRLRRLDGSIGWMETNARMRRDEQGQPTGIEGYGREVGKLVAAEQELQKVNEFLEEVIECVPMLLAVTDGKANVRIWNSGAETLTGYSRNEVVGGMQIWSQLVPDKEYLARMTEQFQRLVTAESKLGAVESTILTRAGEKRSILWNARLVANTEGVVASLVVGLDVTAEKLLQRQLREQQEAHQAELERQVHERTAELERANRDLKRLDEMKGRFLANISHELRTPLVSGLGYVNLILEGGMGRISEKLRKGLTISQQNLKRLAGLIDDLLAFTQHGPSARALRKEPFDLRVLIKECLLDIRGNLRGGVGVTTYVEEGLPPVLADREEIRRVLSNLLTNAEKFTGDHAEIQVRVRYLPPDRVEVQVRDNGIGIPEAERELIFERLYRSSRTDPNTYRGTGIGLFLVRQILDAHGCGVRAEETDSGGTAIIFTLPEAQLSKVE